MLWASLELSIPNMIEGQEVVSQILLRRSCRGSCPCLGRDYAARE